MSYLKLLIKTCGHEVKKNLLNTANIPPFASSLSIGCFKAVISRNVNKNSTTRSLSFRIGAT